MDKIRERFEMVKAMHTLIQALNNEHAYYCHWIYIVPDEATDDDLEYIAEDDELFMDTVRCFKDCMEMYLPDGFYNEVEIKREDDDDDDGDDPEEVSAL